MDIAISLIGGPLDGHTVDVEAGWWGFPPARVCVAESDQTYVLDVDAQLARPFRYRLDPDRQPRVDLDDDRVAAVRGVLGEAGLGPYANVPPAGATVEALHICLLEIASAHGACEGCQLCREIQTAKTIVAALDVVAGPEDPLWSTAPLVAP